MQAILEEEDTAAVQSPDSPGVGVPLKLPLSQPRFVVLSDSKMRLTMDEREIGQRQLVSHGVSFLFFRKKKKKDFHNDSIPAE